MTTIMPPDDRRGQEPLHTCQPSQCHGAPVSHDAVNRRSSDENSDDRFESDSILPRAALLFQEQQYDEVKNLLEGAIMISPSIRWECPLLLAASYLKICLQQITTDEEDQAKKALMRTVAAAEETLDAYLQELHKPDGHVSAHGPAGPQYVEQRGPDAAAVTDQTKRVAALSVAGDLLTSQGSGLEGRVCYGAAIEQQHTAHAAWLAFLASYHRPPAGGEGGEAGAQGGDGGEAEAISLGSGVGLGSGPGGAVELSLRIGRLFTRGGNLAMASQAFRTALALRPACYHATANLANLQYCSGDAWGGIRGLREAVATELRELRGAGCGGERVGTEVEEAVAALLAAVDSSAQVGRTAGSMAALAQQCGDNAAAIRHLQDALRHNPQEASHAYTVGVWLKEAGRAEEAIHYLSLAVSVSPQWAEAWLELGNAYKDSGRIPESVGAYRNALSRNPELKDGVCNMAHALSFMCDWRMNKQLMRLLEAITAEHMAAGKPPSVQPFHALVYPLSLPLISRISRSYGHCSSQIAALDPLHGSLAPVPRLPGERLRVGYVSSDLVNHPLAHLMQSVFGMHDRSQLHVVCFALSPDDGSQYRRKIQSEVETWVDISKMSASEAARLINSLRIHVLFNLNGYTKGARNEIFAFRPAPVQVSYMGFCGTMGAPFIDYLVSDSIASPSALQHLYTEKLVHMPHSYFVNDHKQSHAEVLDPKNQPRRADYGIPDDKIVLCNFNQLYKIDEEAFEVWCDILRACPHTVLWLLRFPQVGEAGVRKGARAHGVADHQIIFTEVAPKAEHVRRGACADLFLDTLQCNAHTTACDILWSGTPLLTSPQLKMSCRVAASLVTALGMQHSLVAHSLQDYKRAALRLIDGSARQWSPEQGKWVTTGLLGELRAEVEAKRLTMPAFDTLRWTRNLEQAIHMMWQVHERGLPPRELQVRDVMDGSHTPGIDLPAHLMHQLLPYDDAANAFDPAVVTQLCRLPPLPLPPNTTPHRHDLHTPPPAPPTSAVPPAQAPLVLLPTPALGCLQPPHPQLLLVPNAAGGLSLAQVGAGGSLWACASLPPAAVTALSAYHPHPPAHPPLGPMLHPLLGSEALGGATVPPPARPPPLLPDTPLPLVQSVLPPPAPAVTSLQPPPPSIPHQPPSLAPAPRFLSVAAPPAVLPLHFSSPYLSHLAPPPPLPSLPSCTHVAPPPPPLCYHDPSAPAYPPPPAQAPPHPAPAAPLVPLLDVAPPAPYQHPRALGPQDGAQGVAGAGGIRGGLCPGQFAGHAQPVLPPGVYGSGGPPAMHHHHHHHGAPAARHEGRAQVPRIAAHATRRDAGDWRLGKRKLEDGGGVVQRMVGARG